MPFTIGKDDEVTALRWERFLVLLGARDVGDGEERVAAAWDDVDRQPTWAMWRCLFAGDPPPPAWRLVRTLALSHDMIDDERVARWIETGHLAAITTLRFASPALTAASVRRTCEALPGLRCIEVAAMLPVAGELQLAGAASVEEWRLIGYPDAAVAAWMEADVTREVRSLTVDQSQADGTSWWSSPRLAQLRELRLLRGTQGAEELAVLAGRLPATLAALHIGAHASAEALAPLLGRSFASLTHLALPSNGLADRHVEGAALLETEQLVHLDLSHNRIGDTALRAITPRLGALESLDLSATRVGDRGLDSIPATARLRALALGSTPRSPAGLAPLLERCGIGLRALRLPRSGADTAFVEALGASVRLPELELLDLSDCKLDGDGFVHLVTAADLPRLETLRLRGCPLGVCIVIDPPRVRALRELWVDDTQINFPESDVVFDPDALPHLELLHAIGNHFRPETAGVLARFGRQRPLRDLALERSVHWDSEELAPLIEAAAPGLVRLQLGNLPSHGGAIARALGAATFPHLVHLDARGFAHSPADITAIAANPTLTELTSLWLDGDSVEHVAPLAASPVLGRLELLVMYGVPSDEGHAALRRGAYHSPFTTALLG
jgi:hypothetical protein